MTISRFKSHRIAVAGALASLAACDSSPPANNVAAPVPVASATPAGVRALPEAAQLKLAFRTLYGKDGGSTIKDDEAGALDLTPGKLLWIGDTAALLSPGVNETDCHACTGTLAIAYLKPKGDGFEVTGKWPTLVVGSGWGQAPQWKVSDAFTDYPAIVAETGWSGQGYSCSGASITELKPDGPVQSDRVWLANSNEGAVDEDTGKTIGGDPLSQLDGRITDIVKGKSFAVKAGGTASFVEKYEYRGGKFVPLQKESRLSC